QLDGIIQALKQAGVTRAVMVGGIAKPRLFREFKPDARALAVVARCGTLRDDVLLRALAQELESEGIRIVESTLYLQEIVPAEGVLSARTPSPEEWADIHFGFRAAKVIGQFDIGQSVVVRGSAVVAGEGIGAPAATIRRPGQRVNADIVVVKACKPTQDLRFDLPAVGPDTIRTIAEVRGRALAMEAHRTIILDWQGMIARAEGCARRWWGWGIWAASTRRSTPPTRASSSSRWSTSTSRAPARWAMRSVSRHRPTIAGWAARSPAPP